MRGKNLFLFIGIVFGIILSLNLVTAAYSATLSHVYINRTLNTQINLTITAPTNVSLGNLTLINITLPQQFSFVIGSNITTLSDKTFGNSINNIWWNPSSFAFENDITQNFIFNITSNIAGDAYLTVIARAVNNSIYPSTFTVVTNFRFDGYIKNETAGLITNATAEIYQFTPNPNGPPTETLESRVNSSSTGLFTFPSINGSAQMYKIKIYFANLSGTITKTSSILPSFPSDMYYPDPKTENFGFEFMKKPSLNGTSFYLQPAATLSLKAINATGENLLFGYTIMDQATGMEIATNLRTNVSNINITVPVGRTYTVMILREPSIFAFSNNCNGIFYNNSHCPTPPKSNSTVSVTTNNAGTTISIQLNLTIVKRYLYGCIVVTGNTSSINITSIYPKLLPWTGFVPPIRAETGDINLSNTLQVNYSDSRCTGMNQFAWYNITLMNSVYLLEFYGGNNTVGSGGSYFGGIYNISLENSNVNVNMNITLRPLYGIYPTGSGIGELNVTKVKVNVLNSTGGAITTNMNVEFIVKNPIFGTLHYILGSDQITNGTFYMPVMNNSNWVKVTIFSNNGPPIEKTLNLSASENNISMPTGELGFRKVLPNGTLSTISNLTQTPINMTFLLNTEACSTLAQFTNPSASCIITTMDAQDFNPLKVLAAGKVNMIVKMKSTNVSVVYHNFDMFNAKPPTNTLMNENATSYGTQQQVWQFGSFAPSNVYDNVTILIPYSNNSLAVNYINESWSFKMKIPGLYSQDLQNSEQLNLAWNSSTGDTNTLPDEFADYNNLYYDDYLSSTGASCSSSDSSSSCYIDTTNDILYMRLPHFSGTQESFTGTAPTGTTTPPATAGSSGGGIATPSFWTGTIYVPTATELTGGYTKALEVKERVKVPVGIETHYVGVKSLTSTQATISISSNETIVTLAIGEEAKADVNNDKIYDIYVKLNSIASNKADVTIKTIAEAVPEGEGAVTTTATEQAAAKTQKLLMWVGIIVGIVIIIAIIFVISKSSKKRRYFLYGY